MSTRESGGFRWDTGPSLLTMPEVVSDLWKSLGRRMEEDLTLTRLPSTCRYHWRDGTVIDEDQAFWHRDDVQNYLKHAKGIYQLSADAFLKNAPDELWRQFTLANLRNLIHLPKVASTQSLHALNESFFKDLHLIDIFDRFATYNGSSPYQTPAVFSIIPYVQYQFGGHYIQGGMVQLARALTRIARDLNVTVLTDHEIVRVNPSTQGQYQIFTQNKEFRGYDFVICNQDAIQAMQSMKGAEYLPKNRSRRKPDASTSGLIVFLGLKTRNPNLQHHNIIFSRNYPNEFKQIHGDKHLANDPTIYISITSRSDYDAVRANREAWFVLVNTPAHRKNSYTAAEYHTYAEKITQTLLDEHLILNRSDIVERHVMHPLDFRAQHNAWRGSLYGYASHGLMSSFQRPGLRHPRLPNFYFTGGTTHPGGGVPLVLLSGQIVARKVAARAGLNLQCTNI